MEIRKKMMENEVANSSINYRSTWQVVFILTYFFTIIIIFIPIASPLPVLISSLHLFQIHISLFISRLFALSFSAIPSIFNLVRLHPLRKSRSSRHCRFSLYLFLLPGELNELWSLRVVRSLVAVVVNPYSTRPPLFTALKTFDHEEELRNSDLLPTPTVLANHLETITLAIDDRQ